MNQPDNDKKTEQLPASNSQFNEEKKGISKQDELPKIINLPTFPS